MSRFSSNEAVAWCRHRSSHCHHVVSVFSILKGLWVVKQNSRWRPSPEHLAVNTLLYLIRSYSCLSCCVFLSPHHAEKGQRPLYLQRSALDNIVHSFNQQILRISIVSYRCLPPRSFWGSRCQHKRGSSSVRKVVVSAFAI